LTVVSVLMHGKTVQCDDSAEIGSVHLGHGVHDNEQGSENRPVRNAIQDRLKLRLMVRMVIRRILGIHDRRDIVETLTIKAKIMI